MWKTNHLLIRPLQLRWSPKAVASLPFTSTAETPAALLTPSESIKSQEGLSKFKVSRIDDLGENMPLERNSALNFLHIISAEVVGENLLSLESHSWLRVTAGCRRRMRFWKHKEWILTPLWVCTSAKLSDDNSCCGNKDKWTCVELQLDQRLQTVGTHLSVPMGTKEILSCHQGKSDWKC